MVDRCNLMYIPKKQKRKGIWINSTMSTFSFNMYPVGAEKDLHETSHLLPAKCACKISPFPATVRNDKASLFLLFTNF